MRRAALLLPLAFGCSARRRRRCDELQACYVEAAPGTAPVLLHSFDSLPTGCSVGG